MRLYSYHGVWYFETYVYDAARRRRRRVKRSTGIRDDGTSQSRRTAEIVARPSETQIAATGSLRSRKTTIARAIEVLGDGLMRRGRSEPTIEIVNEKSLHLCSFFGAACSLETITLADLDEYVDYRLSQGAARGTIEREVRTLRQAWREARRAELIDRDPPPKPHLGVTYIPRDRWLPRTEVLRLLSALTERWREHTICYLQLGLRASELYRIVKGDCDFALREVRIRGTKTEKSDRHVPMTVETHEILINRCAQRRHEALFERWWQIDRDLKAACAKAGIASVSANDLRRTYATECARAGVPIITLARIMGTGIRMLERTYAQCAVEDRQAAAARIPSYNLDKCWTTRTAKVDKSDNSTTPKWSKNPEKQRSGG